MEIKQVTIELNEDTIRRLEEKALKAGKNPESLAADLIKTGLGDNPGQSGTFNMPGVAMLKETSEPILSVAREAVSGPGLFKNSATPLSSPATPDLPPERLRRKAELEDKMRELALVIETADESDKEKYGMQYAILAAELDALI